MIDRGTLAASAAKVSVVLNPPMFSDRLFCLARVRTEALPSKSLLAEARRSGDACSDDLRAWRSFRRQTTARVMASNTDQAVEPRANGGGGLAPFGKHGDGVRLTRAELLTADEVAELLQLRLSTVQDYARRGLIPSFKLGRFRRFVRADVEAALELLRESGGYPSAS